LVYFVAWNYTGGTNWGVEVNRVGQGGAVGRRTQEGKTTWKGKTYGKTSRKDFIGKAKEKTIQPAY